MTYLGTFTLSNWTRITGSVIVFHISLHNETQKTRLSRRNSVVYTFARKVSDRLFVCPLDQPRRPPSESSCVEDFSSSSSFFSTFLCRRCNKSRRLQASIPNPCQDKKWKGW
jgi:hypothetical protein